jgi:hypothetical protein
MDEAVLRQRGAGRHSGEGKNCSEAKSQEILPPGVAVVSTLRERWLEAKPK